MIVTVPEHRLSMENKAIELAWKGETGASRVLHQALDLLKKHGRDVLDESDAILGARLDFSFRSLSVWVCQMRSPSKKPAKAT